MRTVTREVVNPTPNGDTIIRITLPHVSIIDGPWVEEINTPIEVETPGGTREDTTRKIKDLAPVEAPDYGDTCRGHDRAFINRLRKFCPEKYTPKNVRPEPLHKRTARDPNLRGMIEKELSRRAEAREKVAVAEEERRRLAELEKKIGNKMKQVKRAVCHVGGISIAQLTGPTRRQDIVYWRFIAAYILNDRYGYSYPHIGKGLGGRDHTSILHSVRTVRSNPALYAADIKRVEALL